MIDDYNVVLISYPTGGFGNFIFHALTECASNTFKVENNFEFSTLGDSHSTKKYTDVYFHDPSDYKLVKPDTDKLVLVLCDNGINNDSYTKVRKVFPSAKIIRVCITSATRPIIYQTCIIKARRSDIVEETSVHVNTHWDDSSEVYAIRENITLMYHSWGFGWEPNNDSNTVNVSVEDIITNPSIAIGNLIQQIGGTVIDSDRLNSLCSAWHSANASYFEIYHNWIDIEQALDSGRNLDITHISDIHTQGYINYCIERKYNISIRVFDYRDWFKSTDEIQKMVENEKKYIS